MFLNLLEIGTVLYRDVSSCLSFCSVTAGFQRELKVKVVSEELAYNKVLTSFSHSSVLKSKC